jgi:hypothetical protein
MNEIIFIALLMQIYANTQIYVSSKHIFYEFVILLLEFKHKYYNFMSLKIILWIYILLA